MREFSVNEIKHGSYFSKNAYLDDSGFILATPEMPFVEEISNFLIKWSFKKVLCDGELNDAYINKESSVSNASSQTNTSSQTSAGSQPSAGKTSASKTSGAIDFSQQADAGKIEKAEAFYSSFLYYVETVFAKASVSDALDYKEITEKIRGLVDYIKDERRFLMRVLKNTEPAPDKNYLATHSVRSTIISIVVGSYLKLPPHRLLELGVASLVHEAGMLKLPSHIYLSDKQLTPQDQKAITTHPVLGYSMLKALDFPMPICLAALEHHERENATGYPRRLTSDKISLYSKIIAVACSYEALSSKRPHKEAKDGYTGMLELLKNEGKRYDDTVVKALVISLSIYPIGLFVMLSNNKKGQVVDVNLESPRFPIVQVFGEFTPDGKIRTAQTSQDGLTIVRPLTRAEIET